MLSEILDKNKILVFVNSEISWLQQNHEAGQRGDSVGSDS